MNAEIFPAREPEDAYKPDPHNNPIQPEDMLLCLLWRAKAHLLLCSGDNDAEEGLAAVHEKYIFRAIDSVVGMLDQAEKTVLYWAELEDTIPRGAALQKIMDKDPDSPEFNMAAYLIMGQQTRAGEAACQLFQQARNGNEFKAGLIDLLQEG